MRVVGGEIGHKTCPSQTKQQFTTWDIRDIRGLVHKTSGANVAKPGKSRGREGFMHEMCKQDRSASFDGHETTINDCNTIRLWHGGHATSDVGWAMCR